MSLDNIDQSHSTLELGMEDIVQLQKRIEDLKNELEQQHIDEKQELKKEIIQNALINLSNASGRINKLNDLKAEEQQNEINTIETILEEIESSKNEIASLKEKVLHTGNTQNLEKIVTSKLSHSSKRAIEGRLKAINDFTNSINNKTSSKTTNRIASLIKKLSQ